MKLKAIAKGNILWLDMPLKFKQNEVEVEISDDDVQIAEEGKGKNFLKSLWDTVGAFPESSVNWKKEWQKHLEEKHG